MSDSGLKQGQIVEVRGKNCIKLLEIDCVLISALLAVTSHVHFEQLHVTEVSACYAVKIYPKKTHPKKIQKGGVWTVFRYWVRTCLN